VLSDDAFYVQFTPCFYLSDKPYVLFVMPSGVKVAMLIRIWSLTRRVFNRLWL